MSLMAKLQSRGLTASVTEPGGPKNHKALLGREEADQHPMDAITGLSAALAGKLDKSHGENIDNPHGVTAAQVGARPDTWLPTAAEVGARSADWMPTAAQVGARPDTWLPTPAEIAAAPATESTDYPGCYYRMVDGRQEWLNPPRVVGQEYATTQRYQGKVVYSQLVDLGLSANGKGTSMNVLNQYSIVGMFGWINNRPMPMIADTLDSANSAWLFMGTGGTAWKVIIYCGSSMANRQTYVRLDYTKE